MGDNNDKIQQFVNVTGVEEERARFYLESSAWQLEVAISSFYEDGGLSDEPVSLPASATPPRAGSEPDLHTSSSPSVTQPEKPGVRPKKSTKFATVHTLNNSSDDDEEEGQAFYAGGSEHSGQQVLGPSKKKDIVADMFKSVQESGVEILEPGVGSSSRAFRGTGYRLGQNSSDTETVPGAIDPPPPQQVTLKLWRDGFSLNDGELRSYTESSNRDFLDSIRRGEIPQELREGSSEIHLNMEDHRMETFRHDERKGIKPFSGQGYTLGSPAPPVVGAPREEDREVNEAHARQALQLDSSQPTTNIQIRLADGSRLLGQFNHGHTLGQVRSYIIAARPQYQTRPFALLSTYPSRELEDSQTIIEAGLLNSAIMQKLK